jgi:5-hydroxyisourate hydrolase-like protein (transthyretin family)
MAAVLNVLDMKRILIPILFILQGSSLVAQTDIPHERLYLSTDKECYLAGEPLWVSAFCYDATTGKPSAVSAVAYLEIQNLTSSLVQSKIALKKGRGNGMVLLPATLPTGIYRLTGYTRYMYSENALNYYSKYLTIYNPLSSIRSDNVTAIGKEQEEVTASYDMQDEESKLFQISTNKKQFKTQQEVKLTLKNLLPDFVSASVSVFHADGLNYHKNPSITTVVDSTLHEQTSDFKFHRVDYTGEVIHGHIVDENNVPTPYVEGFGTYLSIAGSEIQYFTGEIRENGKVRFFTSNLHGNGTLVSHVPSLTEKKYHLVLDSIYLHPTVEELPTLSLDEKQAGILTDRSLAVQVYQTFRMDTLSPVIPYENNLLFENSGIVYKLDEYTRFPTMAEVVVEFIQEVRFRTVKGERKLQVRLRDAHGVAFEVEDPTPPLVLLDGIPVPNHNKIYNYPPSLVKEITIYPDKYAFGPIYYNGIIFLKTYRGDFPELELEESMRIQDFQGVQHPRTFGVVPEGSRLPDLRHTLYWNPRVDLHANESVTLLLKTAETTGTFVVVAEGMSKEGVPFRTQQVFRVDP